MPDAANELAASQPDSANGDSLRDLPPRSDSLPSPSASSSPPSAEELDSENGLSLKLSASRSGSKTAATATISAAPRDTRGSSGESLEPPSATSASSGSGEDDFAPMDLSSGGGTMANPLLAASGFPSPFLAARSFAESGNGAGLHQLLNSKNLADFVKAQQALTKEMNETTPPNNNGSEGVRLPKKRQWPAGEQDEQDSEEKSSPSPANSAEEADGEGSKNNNRQLIPLELIRAKWEKNGANLPAGREGASPESSASGSTTPSSGPRGVATGGREVKKRRLDALLNRKFGDSPASSVGSRSPPHAASSPKCIDVEDDETPSEVTPIIPKKINRRKQSHPTNSPSPEGTIAIRPHSELFPQHKRRQSLEEEQRQRELREEQRRQREYDEARRAARKKREEEEELPRKHDAAGEKAQQDLVKSQLLQLQLAQAALLSGVSTSGSNPDFIKSALMSSSSLMGNPPASPGSAPAAANNPLMYYGYYAQMFQGLQAQQSKLVEQLMSAGQRSGARTSSPSPSPRGHDRRRGKDAASRSRSRSPSARSPAGSMLSPRSRQLPQHSIPNFAMKPEVSFYHESETDLILKTDILRERMRIQTVSQVPEISFCQGDSFPSTIFAKQTHVTRPN